MYNFFFLGWEVPEGYDFEHLPPTPANVALWRKKQDLGDYTWDYLGGDTVDIAQGTHPWYHGQDSHLPHEVHEENVNAPIDDGHGHHKKGHH